MSQKLGTTFSRSVPLESVVLNRVPGVSLHRQLYLHLRALIEGRVLKSDTALPSTRQMARDLDTSRNTVIAAYDQLALEGFLSLRRGSAARVSQLPSQAADRAAVSGQVRSPISGRGSVMLAQPYHHGKPGLTAFHPGLPDSDNFPFNTWSRLLARRAKLARHDLFGFYHVKGYPPLCEAIARYLAASRGVQCRPEQVVVTNGAQSAFDLLARLLTDPGDTVWMEEPGYHGAGAAFVSAGAHLAPMRVSSEGWDLTAPANPPRAIFVTPACHHPLGVTMPMDQRLRLVHLAEDWNAWIIEDDYDSEYRFQGQPIPALQGISTSERVVYVGTFAKILFPAMRLGFFVVPESMEERIVAALTVTGQFAPLVTQAALADFMNEGHFSRHLRRMRRLYAQRRQVFVDTCERELGHWLRLQTNASGIQLVGYLRGGQDDVAIAGHAQRLGVNVSPLSIQHRHEPRVRGLVLGFAATDEKATARAMARLRSVFLAGESDGA